MKKVAIVTRRMVMGGIEKALIAMLENMPRDKYDVTLYLMGDGGELLNEVPKYVKIKFLYGNEKTLLEKLWKNLLMGKILYSMKIGWYALLSKKSKSIFDQEIYHSKMLGVEDIDYDLAIAYHVPASFPVVFVMNNLKAKRKVAWIHSDVSHYKKVLELYFDYYQRYDGIYCVSQNALVNFVRLFPNLKKKTSVFYNIIDRKKMDIMASEGIGYDDNFNGIRILTVGRLTFEKGHDLIPHVLKKLMILGYNLRWYCIGDGDCRPGLEKAIKENNLQEHLILLGMKKNPYPYIKNCNVYVQPSRHEGYCITLAEARAFNKPIVTTDFIGAREQIENDVDGLIVKFDCDEMFYALRRLLSDRFLCNKLSGNLETKNIKNSVITKKTTQNLFQRSVEVEGNNQQVINTL